MLHRKERKMHFIEVIRCAILDRMDLEHVVRCLLYTSKLARAKCNERQGDVCNEIHPLDKTYRDQV